MIRWPFPVGLLSTEAPYPSHLPIIGRCEAATQSLARKCPCAARICSLEASRLTEGSEGRPFRNNASSGLLGASNAICP